VIVGNCQHHLSLLVVRSRAGSFVTGRSDDGRSQLIIGVVDLLTCGNRPMVCQRHARNDPRAFVEETLPAIQRQRRCRCTACGWRRADLRPDYSVKQTGSFGGGWMMPP